MIGSHKEHCLEFKQNQVRSEDSIHPGESRNKPGGGCRGVSCSTGPSVLRRVIYHQLMLSSPQHPRPLRMKGMLLPFLITLYHTQELRKVTPGVTGDLQLWICSRGGQQKIKRDKSTQSGLNVKRLVHTMTSAS